MIPAKQFFREIADELNRHVHALPTLAERIAFVRAVEGRFSADPFQAPGRRPGRGRPKKKNPRGR